MNNTKKLDIKNQQIKIIVAFLATAVVPAILCSALYFIPMMNKSLSGEFLQTPFEEVNSPSGVMQSSIGFGIISFFVALFHIIILGVPLFLLGLRLSMIRWWTTLIGAFIVGGLPYFIFGALIINISTPKTPLDTYLKETATMGLFGLSGGVIFWILWRHWIQEKSSNNSDAEN
ncbi:MAG: hypothetical protein JNK81_14265 [Anaerolineales bacterium]|nr:hypothetical protein [Anaerolineales bacterium]